MLVTFLPKAFSFIVHKTWQKTQLNSLQLLVTTGTFVFTGYCTELVIKNHFVLRIKIYLRITKQKSYTFSKKLTIAEIQKHSLTLRTILKLVISSFWASFCHSHCISSLTDKTRQLTEIINWYIIILVSFKYN